MAMMTLFLLSVLLHGFLGWRLLPALDAWPAAQWGLGALLALSAALVPMSFYARRIRRQPLSDRLATAGFLFMGWFSSMFVLTLLREVVLLLDTFVGHGWTGLARMSAELAGDMAWAVFTGAALFTLVGWVNARRTAQVVKVDVPIAGLPKALQGFTIAQISDIHVGPTIKQAYLQPIVQKVNQLKADMVAITGDLVDGSVHDLAPHVSPLAELDSRHGTYFVTGNHEYYSGAHGWIDELRRLGLRVLLNEHVVVQHDVTSVVIAGVTDYTAHHFDPSHRSDPHAAVRGAPADAVKLLLAHQPRSAQAAEEAGFHLQLSGHTHGGQFWPWRLAVPLQQPFVAGLKRLKRMWIYTSRGTGFWGPPKRLCAPSEITLLRLVGTD